MAEVATLDRCDSTWNPWRGCTEVSPGCDRFDAEASPPARSAAFHTEAHNVVLIDGERRVPKVALSPVSQSIGDTAWYSVKHQTSSVVGHKSTDPVIDDAQCLPAARPAGTGLP